MYFVLVFFFGSECVGIIMVVGFGVDDLVIGDEVVVIVLELFVLYVMLVMYMVVCKFVLIIFV